MRFSDRKELIQEPVRFMAWILAFEAHSTNGVLWVGLSAEVIKAIAALRVVARDFVTTRIDVLLAEEERILREERQKSNAATVAQGRLNLRAVGVASEE